MDKLRVGQHFRTLQGRTVDGQIVRLPDDLNGRISIILFYRGHW